MTDRLFALLPVYVRQRDDATAGQPLRSLLRVIEEQTDRVQDDIAGLYANWFIETCEPWVVPYIGDLVGYRSIRPTGSSEVPIARSDVANTIRTRRRKGTLSVLATLAGDIGGWPAIAWEYDRAIAATQCLNDQRPSQGQTLDLRDALTLTELHSEFSTAAHTLEIRRPGSLRVPGRYGPGSVGIIASRIRPHTVSRSDARCRSEAGEHCFTFDALGTDTPLVSTTSRLPHFIDRTHIAHEYGLEKSIAIWARTRDRRSRLELVPADRIVPADLHRWSVRVRPGEVAVDPQRGRLCFAPGHAPGAVVVRYAAAAAADIGAGEYPRELEPFEHVFRVAHDGREEHAHLRAAVDAWRASGVMRAAIELGDSHVYDERDLAIELAAGQHLEIRAADGARPIVRIEDDDIGHADILSISGERGSSIVFDGLLLTGRGLDIGGELADVTLRRCTLTPHDTIVRLTSPTARLSVDRCLLGRISVIADETQREPNAIAINDSVIDATTHDRDAIGAPDAPSAFATLSAARSTFLGHVRVHAIERLSDSLFRDPLLVARRQRGCLRFCYIAPQSRTPDRYECQPDRALRGASVEATAVEDRLAPVFVSTHAGTPGYARLDPTAAPELRTGAEDESELGVFHDNDEPIREANLRARLAQFVPANADVGIFYVRET